MDFKSLSIRNFLTIGEAQIDLDKRGLVAIEGVNKDDPSASSNGSGKSSIVDALCWCLYGTTARGEGGDDIVNDKAGKDCQVTVVMQDGAIGYTVTRHRKHTTGKNSLHVVASDPPAIAVFLTKGTDKETQETLIGILGCTLDVFVASVYSGQEKMPDLPGMTDKMLKLLVEEASGTQVLAEAHRIALKRVSDEFRAVAVSEAQVAAAVTHAKTAAAQLESDEAFEDIFETSRPILAKKELEKATDTLKELRATEAKLKPLDRVEWEKALSVAETTIASYAGMVDRQRELMLDESKTNDAWVTKKVQWDAAESKVERCRVEELTASSMLGKPCPVCAKPHLEEDLEPMAIHLNAVTLKAVKESEALSEGLVAAAKELGEARDRLALHRKVMPDLTVAHHAKMVASLTLRDIDALTIHAAELRKLISVHKDGARVCMTVANPYKVQVAKSLAAKVAAGLELVYLETTLELAKRRLSVKESATKVYGPAGVRAHILDTVTPLLNERTKEYLGALSDGNIHATWNTLSRTAKGELREKFSIEVVNTKGGKKFGLISGGEKRKARLACAMALQDLVASRATKPINLFMADEVDEALDEPGLERLMGVLEAKAKVRGTVLVISHRSLSDWIDQVIVVTKEGGVSTVIGATSTAGVW